MPMTSPVSMSMMMVARKEAIQRNPSSLERLANFGRSYPCMNMPFRATTMMADKMACNEKAHRQIDVGGVNWACPVHSQITLKYYVMNPITPHVKL